MVIIKKCESYDIALVTKKIKESLDDIDAFKNLRSTDKVFIKCNCVSGFEPSRGITTHPVVLQSVIRLLKEKTNNIIVGDNPAIKDMVATMKKCGLYDVIIKEGCEFLRNTEFETITNSHYKIYSSFEVSANMVNVDMIVNLPKIKTHSLTYMTVAQKNFFGLIYGLNKSSWHTKASDPQTFGNALNDLYGALLEKMDGKPIVNIADGIIGLEGEGPSSGGHAIMSGVLLTSLDAISLDRVAVELVHMDYKKLFINQIASDRGYGEGHLDKIVIKGDPLSSFDIHYTPPKDALSNIGLRFLKLKPIKSLLLEHPKINKDKCIKCGACAKICPAQAMTIKKGEYPKLEKIKCIRCWCCAEICPNNAIEKTKRPILGKIILKTDK